LQYREFMALHIELDERDPVDTATQGLIEALQRDGDRVVIDR
jgi:hypothetical protein